MSLKKNMVYVCLVALLAAILCEAGKKKKGGRRKYSGKCKPQILAEYELAFQGGWSERAYPRMFPKYRPSAQWSKLIGRSHSDKYTMWTEGVLASEAVRTFAENSDTQGFDTEAQAYGGIRDTFTAAPIRGGQGKTATNFLTDGAHSQVSFMVRLVPSPDWFVGIASFSLCEKKKWKSHIKVDLYPLDAGTDKGLTFTSPDWPSEPRQQIYALSPSKPAHSASAFYYTNMTSLPPIARVYLTKIAEYRRKGKTPPTSKQERNLIIYDNENAMISTEDVIHKLERIIGPTLEQSKQASGNEIQPPKHEPPAEKGCIVSAWSAWTPCSVTCGFGRQERRRTIKQRGTTRGMYCPVLREDRACELAECEWHSFAFLNRKV